MCVRVHFLIELVHFGNMGQTMLCMRVCVHLGFPDACWLHGLVSPPLACLRAWLLMVHSFAQTVNLGPALL